jgi:Superfamily I DNA and RNA helicases
MSNLVGYKLPPEEIRKKLDTLDIWPKPVIDENAVDDPNVPWDTRVLSSQPKAEDLGFIYKDYIQNNLRRILKNMSETNNTATTDETRINKWKVDTTKLPDKTVKLPYLKKLTTPTTIKRTFSLNAQQKEIIKDKNKRTLVIASAGSGKCIVGNSLILLKNNLVRMSEIPKLANMNLVSSNNEYSQYELEYPVMCYTGSKFIETPSSHFFRFNRSKILEVVTENGYTLSGTYMHKIFTTDYTELQKLQINDTVPINTINTDSTYLDFLDYNKINLLINDFSIYDTYISSKVLQLRRQELAYFLYNIFGSRKPTWFVNKQLSIDLQILLLTCGIFCKREETTHSKEFNSNNTSSIYKILITKDDLNELLNVSTSNKVQEKVIFDKIVQINKRHAVVYDFTIPDYHNFIANGFINHNTAVLTNRVIHLINDEDVDPERILLLTFTVKAGEEMRERVAAKLSERIAKFISCATFHSWAHRILRKYCAMLNVNKDFSILDSSDGFDTWVKCAALGDCNCGSTRQLYSCYSLLRNKQLEPDEVVKQRYPQMSGKLLKQTIDNFTKNIETYVKYKKKYSMMDFDDLLELIQLALHNDKKFRMKISALYDYILVDEVQDCNGPQLDILLSLVKGNKENRKVNSNLEKISLFAVGDETQCWYENSIVKVKEHKKIIKRKVKDLKKNDKIQCILGDKIKYEPITNISKEVSKKLINIKTKLGYILKVTPTHKCFVTQPSFTEGYIYNYLMYNPEYGFRTGTLTGGESHTFSNRANFEGATHLWILNYSKNKQVSYLKEQDYSLYYGVPKLPFKHLGRNLTLTQKSIDELFKKYGNNGEKLLKSKHLIFDYPAYIAQGTEKHQHKHTVVNIIFNQKEYGMHHVNPYSILVRAENLGKIVQKGFNSYYEALIYAKQLKKEFNANSIVEKFRCSQKTAKARFLNVVTANQVVPTMKIPVIHKGEMILDEITDVTVSKNSYTVYDIEVSSAGNVISNNIVSHNSIYGFRGADYKNMLRFPEEFKSQIKMLLTNYRSTNQILHLANNIGDHFTTAKWKKKMIGTYDGEKPYYVRVQDENVQAEFVAETIKDMIQNRKFAGKEIAVLYRSNSSSTLIELALASRKILFEKRGGQALLDMAHIKDILSFFKSAFFHSDVIGWSRMLELHPKIGSVTAENIYTTAFESKNPYKVLLNTKKYGIKQNLSELGDLLLDLRSNNKDTTYCMKRVLSYIKPMMINKYGEVGWNNDRMKSVNVFANIVSVMPSIKKMLIEFSLNPNGQPSKSDTAAELKQGGKVILGSVHSAKGLEWNNVFIINVNEGKFPSYWFVYDGKPPANIADTPPDPDKIDEERRLFYVACTRARHNLVICSPMSAAEYSDYLTYSVVKDANNSESVFINEIEKFDDLAKVIMPIKLSESTSNKKLKSIYDEYE